MERYTNTTILLITMAILTITIMVGIAILYKKHTISISISTGKPYFSKILIILHVFIFKFLYYDNG